MKHSNDFLKFQFFCFAETSLSGDLMTETKASEEMIKKLGSG